MSRHLLRQDLEERARGNRPLAELLEHLLFHLVEVDPASRDVALALLDRLGHLEPEGAGGAETGPEAPVAGNDVAAGSDRLGDERKARRVEGLLARAERLLRTSPHGAARLAERAVERARELASAGGPPRPLLVRALGRWGNALRAAGRLAEAERILLPLVGERALRPSSSAQKAELLSLVASLRKDQRRFKEARRFLVRALDEYYLLRDRGGQVRTLLKKASVHFHAGEPEAAVEATRAAFSRLAPGDEPLFSWTQHNLVSYLAACGRFEEALAEWRAHEPPPEAQEAQTMLRRRWLRGQIAAGLDDDATAEEIFRTVQTGFLEHGLGYPGAMVSLDLAQLLLRQGRTREVKALAAGMTWLFETADIHREALAALLLFRSAAEAEGVTLATVRRLARYLEEARANPALRFQEPS